MVLISSLLVRLISSTDKPSAFAHKAPTPIDVLISSRKLVALLNLLSFFPVLDESTSCNDARGHTFVYLPGRENQCSS